MFRPAIRLAHEHTSVVMQRREVRDFCLVYFFAASGVCQINGVDHPFNPRTLLVEPPFKPSHFEMAPSMSTRHIAVHFDVCEGFPDRKPLDQRKPYEIRLPPDLEIPAAAAFPDKYPLPQLLLQLVEAWQRRDIVGQLQANALLSQVLLQACLYARMANRPAEHSRVHESVAAAVRHIEAHFAEPLSLEIIADVAGYSANYLARMFRTGIGSSVMEFLTMVRMRRATEFLRNPQHSVKEIARLVGYQNSKYFSRTFQETHGFTPTQWRLIKSEPRPGAA